LLNACFRIFFYTSCKKNKTAGVNKLGSLAVCVLVLHTQIHDFAPPSRGGFAFVDNKTILTILQGY